MRNRLIYLRIVRAAEPVLLVLAPLALLAGIWLMAKNDPNLHVGMAIDRAQAIAIARQTAATKGLDAAQWDGFCKVEHFNDRYFYYRIRRAAGAESVRQFAPEVTVSVLLLSPDSSQRFEVTLAPDGRVLGWNKPLPRGSQVSDPGAEAAARIAETAFRTRPEAQFISPALTPVTTEEDNSSSDIRITAGRQRPVVRERPTGNSIRRHYAWDWPVTSLPELKRQVVVEVQGDQVVRERTETDFADSFSRQYLESNTIGLIIFGIVYGLAVLVIILFGIYRFVQRVRQKEVSYLRMLLLALISACTFIFFALQTDVAVYATVSSGGPQGARWVGLISSVIVWLLIGLLIGMAYASGEGDIREAFPGKLTGLDSLLSGRIFSRNVARSIVHGAAIGCWAVLLLQLIVWPWAQRADAGWQLTQLHLLLGQQPWLIPLYGWMTHSILLTVSALLLPLPFLLRRMRNRRVIFALTFLLAFGTSTAFTVEVRPWTAVLLAAMVLGGAFLLAFLRFGLQTAFFSTGAVPLISTIMYLTAQPAHSTRQAGFIAATLVSGFVVIQTFFYFRGRLYRDEDVRPHYARFLAERLAMQAEVSAAREAQIRLLPQKLPAMSQLSLVADCRPAREVGGDFYDFFPLDENRLGIFMAEGGGQGLGSALSIAFAKGFLMPKLREDSGGDNSPVEIVRSLQSRLSAMRAQSEGFGFAYAVIDVSDGSLRYARTGRYPRVALTGRNSEGKICRPEETEIRFSVEGTTETAIHVLEGMVFLSPGDLVSFFTSGIGDAWADDRQAVREGFLKAIVTQRPDSAGKLPVAFARAMKETAREAQRKGVHDDLTAVVIRFEGQPRTEFVAPALTRETAGLPQTTG